MKTKFYKCPVCGNIVVKIQDSGVTPVCCGQPMEELQARNVDSLIEKHVPVVDDLGNDIIRVKIGAHPHPMTSDHHISFLWLQTSRGAQLRYLGDDAIEANCPVKDGGSASGGCPVPAGGKKPACTCAGFFGRPTFIDDDALYQPCARFNTAFDPLVATFAYCNIHGLWIDEAGGNQSVVEALR